MALLTKVGSFNKNNGTGAQAVTGIGFTPKAILFWTFQPSGWVSGTWAPGYSALFGMTAGPANSYCVQTTADDNVGTAAGARRTSAKAIAATNNIASGLRFEADLQSFDADGFTLNWTSNAGGGADLIYYLALGGSDITNAKAVDWTTVVAAGNKAVTGVGFKPDLVVHASATNTTLSASALHGFFSVGAMNKHGQQFFNSFSALNLNPSSTSRWQQTDAAIGYVEGGEVVHNQAHFVSMDTDGFTTYFPAPDATAYHNISLCLKGVSSKIGAFIKPAGAGPLAREVGHCGFTPKAVLVSTTGASPQDASTANATWGFGATDGTNHRAGLITDGDAVSPTQADGVGYTDSPLAVHGGLGVTGSKVTAVGLEDDGFIFVFGTNDATESEIAYLALGDAGVNTYPIRVA